MLASSMGMAVGGPDAQLRAEWKNRLEASRMARAAFLPSRTAAVLRHNSTQVKDSLSWLVRSKEHTNYTYDLTELNWEHLAWWASCVSGRSIVDARAAITEARNDSELQAHVRRLTLASERRRLADLDVRLGRRVGWYALVRLIQPSLVIETGTDKGLGSVTLAQAIRRNGSGRLITIDNNPAAGYLMTGYEDVCEIQIGDSIDMIRRLQGPVDLFIHDSSHTRQHEATEFEAITRLLPPTGVVLSDNSHVTDALPAWAAANGRAFLFFGERPAHHWYPGAGIGAAWLPSGTNSR